MKNLLILFVLILSLSNFTTINNSSERKDVSYIKEIPFDFEFGLPIIKVSINDKDYNFLFDTGMPTTISNNISKELNLKTVRTRKGMDVNRNTSQENYVIIDEIKVAEINFKNIESLSTNLSAGFEIGCLKLDGVLGNNIIKDAIWEIDYERKIIKISNDMANFDIPESAQTIIFTTNAKKGQYSPYVEIKINNKKHSRILFDTGSNQGFSMPLDYYEKSLDPNKSVIYFGQATTALYGKGEKSKYIDSKVKTIQLGNLQLQNEIVSFSNKFPMIGNKFFKNYRIIINYFEQKIYMIKQTENTTSSMESFGFQTKIIDGKSIVSIIYEKSDAENKKLSLGDEILEINDIDIRDLLAKNACDFNFKNPFKELDKVTLLILRNGKKDKISLNKQILIY